MGNALKEGPGTLTFFLYCSYGSMTTRINFIKISDKLYLPNEYLTFL